MIALAGRAQYDQLLAARVAAGVLGLPGAGATHTVAAALRAREPE
jgi:hypothetical protein